MSLLHQGDLFPSLDIRVAGEAAMNIPGAFAGRFGVILFYRGASCRACVEQLRAFQRSCARLDANGIDVLALSTDDDVQTLELATKYGLRFSLGHSADPEVVSATTGAFVSTDPPQLQSTGFVIDPAGRVIVSLYSCGAVGQLLPDDVLEVVRDDKARTARASVSGAPG